MTKSPNAETKLAHAHRWLDRVLAQDDGPRDGRTAVLVIRIDDVEGEPGMGFVNVMCLPDLDHKHLIEGLEKFVADLRAGRLVDEPSLGEEEPKEEGSQLQ